MLRIQFPPSVFPLHSHSSLLFKTSEHNIFPQLNCFKFLNKYLFKAK